MPDPTARDIKRRADLAFSTTERSNSEDAWREIARYMLPNMSAFFITSSQGQGGTEGIKTTTRLFDSTAIKANMDLASYINGTLTNSAVQWAMLEFDDVELSNDVGPDGAKAWLTNATELMFKALNKSNFKKEKGAAYIMLTSLGNMILFQDQILPGENGIFSGFQFENMSVNELAWSENRLGIVDTVFRRMRLSAKKAFERFGDNISDNIKKDLEKNEDNKHDFLHAVFPRNEADIDDLSIVVHELHRPFVSAYIDIKTTKFVELSGYYEFPMDVVRFEQGPNEGYGRGRGHVAIPDAKTINTTIELLFEAAEKGISPPIIIGGEDVGGDDDWSAGTKHYIDDVDQIKQFVTQVNLGLTQLNIDRLELKIKEAFFIDKIMLPPREEIGEMSAFETSKRVEEMQKAIGSTTERLIDEFLTPLILRSFKMMLRGGAFNPIPPLVLEHMSLGQDDLKITYVNTLARSQKFEQLSNIRQLVASAQELSVATSSPEPLDRLNTDEIMKLTEEVLGVPGNIIRNEKDIKQIRDDRNEQQREQQQIDNLLKAGDASSKLNK